MASTIRIKRSATSGNPSTLAAGELAYSSYGGSGGNRLYIGAGTETLGNAANHLVIGGTYYTGLIDASTAGTLTTNASSIPVLSSTGTIDQWYAGNLRLNGNTLSSTNSNGNIALTPNGSGAVQISGAYTLPTTAGTNGYALITNGTSAASWQAISTTLNIAAGGSTSGSVNLLNQTLTVSGGNGITTSISGQTLTISSIGAGGYTSTATGGTTTTLTASNSANQFFTGTTTQTVKLPDTSTLTVGQEYIITNNSTGSLTVQTSAGGSIVTQIGGTQVTYTVASTGAQTWVYEYTGFSTLSGTGSAVLSTSPTIVTPTFTTSATFSGTSSGSTVVQASAAASGTLTLPATTDTLVGKATTDIFTNKTIDTAATGNVFKVNGNQISAYTGSGNTVVLSTSPSLTTPTIGSAGANFSGSTSGTITVAAAAIAGTNTLTLPAATDTLIGKATTDILTNKTLDTAGAGNVLKINGNQVNAYTGTGSTVVLSAAPTITGHPTIEGVTSTGATGTGNFVFATSPTISAPTISGHATIEGVTPTGATGTGNLVFSNTPTFVTPVLGAATATSIVTSAGLVSSGTYGGTYSDGVVVDYVTGNGRISVGSGDGITLYNNTDTTRQSIFAVGSTGAVTLLGGSITGTTAITITAGGSNSNINLVPTGTGTVDHGGARLTSVGTPTQATDAANKAYVDGLKSGLDVKYPVRLATTGTNLTATASGSQAGKTLTNSGTQAALTIDSVPAVVGDRVLIKDQTTQADNGIYTVTNIGSVSTNWVLTRATDFDGTTTNNYNGTVTAGAFVFVEQGTQNANNGYVVTEAVNDVPTIVVDTNPIVFVQFSGAGEITAGNGLAKSGNTLSVVGTANRITVGASVDIASTYVGQNSITTLGTITTGTWQAGVVGPTYGGTGINNGSYTITLGGNISTAGSFTTSGAYALTLTTTASTSVTLPTSGTLATLANSETLTNKTLSTGSTWNGNTVTVGYGGTGFTSATSNGIVYGNGSSALQVTAAAGTSDQTTSYQILTVTSGGTPIWTTCIDGGTY